MIRFLIKWFVSSIALLIVVHVSSGVSFDNLTAVLVMALMLGLLNTFLKPLLSLLSFPIMILTLGLFSLFINALTFFIAAKLVHGFYVAGFGSAFWAALIYSIVTFLINLLIMPGKNVVGYGYTVCYNSNSRRRDHLNNF